MTVTTSMNVDVRSLRRDLRTLRQLEPEYRKQVPDRMKAAAEPMLAATKAAVPNDPPTSGWSTSTKARTGWRPARIRQRIVLKFRSSGFRASANANDVILRMVAKGAALSIADMAKNRRSTTRNTEPWLRALTLRYGSPSRFVWATAERYLPSIQREVARTMDEISREAQAAIRRNA